VREFLLQRGVNFNERRFFKEPLSAEQIHTLSKNAGINQIFSWKSPSFKKMRLEGNLLTETELVGLRLKEPRFIRRPLVQANDILVIGTNWIDLHVLI
jgi:arsenate reductase-like glutaredoxin family protein